MPAIRYLDSNVPASFKYAGLAPVAQLDRALPSEGRGQGSNPFGRATIDADFYWFTARQESPRPWNVRAKGSARVPSMAVAPILRPPAGGIAEGRTHRLSRSTTGPRNPLCREQPAAPPSTYMPEKRAGMATWNEFVVTMLSKPHLTLVA